MADKYYRLVGFIVNICPEPLRDFFTKLARNDAGSSYTTIDAYLRHKKLDVTQLRYMNKISKDQYMLLYPGYGTADEKQWDVTLLVTLITELFGECLKPYDIILFKDEVHGIVNELRHLSNTNISDRKFDIYWTRLETACMTIAKRIYGEASLSSFQKKVNDAKFNILPTLGMSLPLYYGETIKKMDDMLPNKRETTAVKPKKTVTVVNSLRGDELKRDKIVDKILANLQVEFAKTMMELPDTFCPPHKVATIRTKLKHDHYVIVTGNNNSRYTEIALAAIKSMHYNYKRCVEMRNSSDWRHIDPEEVDLVLCRNPFGNDHYEENKAKSMANLFSSMKMSATRHCTDTFDIIIVTDLAVFTECQQYHYHDILKNVVKVNDVTMEPRPADFMLGYGYKMAQKTFSFIANNLEDQDFEQYKKEFDHLSYFEKKTDLIPHHESPGLSQQIIKKDYEASKWQKVTTVEDAMSLIYKEKLPDKQTLCNLVKRLGRRSATVGFVCESICTKIEETTSGVTHVFAAYTVTVENEDNLHFVALFDNVSSKSDSNLDYDIVYRNKKGNVSETEQLQESIALSAEESLALKETINSVSKQFMVKHKYLSAITARKIKSDEGENLCIVLYVHPCTERYSSIPISAEPLPNEIDGYKVVVRNGVFKAATNTAGDYHANVRMGCKITSSNLKNSYGTLGGFIDHPEYGLCGFTCAHVVFNKGQMEHIKENKRLTWSPTDIKGYIYQHLIDSDPVGHVVETIYTEGGDSNTAGIDLALIQINNRPPVSGRSPESSSGEELNYVTGKTCGRSRVTSTTKIEKFGATTGKTSGKIVFGGMAVNGRYKFKTKDILDDVPTIQYNQYEIVNDSSNFCEQGDSGALAFMTDCTNELVCIGMVIGVLDAASPFHGVVTPITDILRELGVTQLKPFQKESTIDFLEKRLTDNGREVQSQQEKANTQLLLQLKTDLPTYIKESVDMTVGEMVASMKEDIKKTIQSEVQSSISSMFHTMKNKPAENNRTGDSSNI